MSENFSIEKTDDVVKVIEEVKNALDKSDQQINNC